MNSNKVNVCPSAPQSFDIVMFDARIEIRVNAIINATGFSFAVLTILILIHHRNSKEK